MISPPPTLPDFQRHFAAVEQRLRADLQSVRARLTHGGNKGTSAEGAFRRALTEFLSRRLVVGNGEVIDTQGARSAQCDVVIATDQHPNWIGGDEPSLFLVEAVAAAAEVKVLLTSEHLDSAIRACQQFRNLRPTWGGKAEVVGANEDVQHYRNPPFFLFAYESQLTIETIAARVAAVNDPARGRSGEGIDGVFVLDRGYVQNYGYGRSGFVAQDGDGDRLIGYYHDDVEAPLMALMRWLPLALAIPLYQLPVLSQYILADASRPAQKG